MAPLARRAVIWHHSDAAVSRQGQAKARWAYPSISSERLGEGFGAKPPVAPNRDIYPGSGVFFEQHIGNTRFAGAWLWRAPAGEAGLRDATASRPRPFHHRFATPEAKQNWSQIAARRSRPLGISTPFMTTRGLVIRRYYAKSLRDIIENIKGKIFSLKASNYLGREVECGCSPAAARNAPCLRPWPIRRPPLWKCLAKGPSPTSCDHRQAWR